MATQIVSNHDAPGAGRRLSFLVACLQVGRTSDLLVLHLLQPAELSVVVSTDVLLALGASRAAVPVSEPAREYSGGGGQ